MTNKDKLITRLILVYFVLCAPGLLRSQEQSYLLQRLQNADNQTSLEDPQLKPWHILLSVRLLKIGQPAENGQIEEWWSSPSLRKISYRFPSYTSTELLNESGFYRTSATQAAPERLSRLLRAATRPGSSEVQDSSHSHLVLNKQNFGAAQLDCIMVAPAGKDLNRTPFGTFETFCLTSDTTSLRATYSFDSMLIARNKLGSFQDKTVAIDLDSTTAVTKVHDAAIHVETLATLPEQTGLYVAGPEMQKALPDPVFVADAIMRDYLLRAVSPTYPEPAKHAHTSGVVLLQVVISEEGKVLSARELQSPSPLLTDAAIEAVKKSIYKPYVLRGSPITVTTIVASSFRFGAS